VVIGGGLVGCTSALALADAGATVTMIVAHRPGAASAAGAGMLAPSIEEARTQLRATAELARDGFPAYLARIRDRSGRSVHLDRSGLLQVALTDDQAEEFRAAVRPPGVWLSPTEVRELEPALASAAGAALWPDDGTVDNIELLVALEWLVGRHPRIRIIRELASRIDAGQSHTAVTTEDGAVFSAGTTVLCAGAWAATIAGARLAAVIEPVRGQLVALRDAGLRHPVFGTDGYLVPRPGCTVAGTTMEHVGFDPSTTREAAASIAAAARTLCPTLAGPVSRAWAGLRPVTPDLLPLIGRDPEKPALIYACGHSRNGILLAPLTGEIVKALIFEESLTFSIDQFHPARFEGTFSTP
jgi:glycine oxidase